MKEKMCTKCKQIQPITEFRKNSRTKDGLLSWCKTCKDIIDKEYRQKTRDIRAKKDKEYRDSLASFSTFAHQLTVLEDPINIDDVISVKCTYCGKRFFPKVRQIRYRLEALNGKVKWNPENRLYCSNDCKVECPIFNQIKHSKDFEIATSREVPVQIRQWVLERDNWSCSICGDKDNSLHCHHVEGATQQPMFSADVENCITVCKRCHKNIHSMNGCKYHQLKRCD